MQHIKTILTIILVSHTLFVNSQTWPKYYGEPDKYDSSEDIIEAYDKGYIMGGKIADYSSGSVLNGWIIKTDINGEILWEKIFDNDLHISQITAIEQSIDGGVLICGAVRRTINKSEPIVIKLNACGEKEWCTIFAGSNQTNPWAQDIKETPSGDIIVLINQYGQDNVEDMHLAKLNAQGELLWMEEYCSGAVYQEAALPIGFKLIITSQNQYLIAGDVYWEDPWNPGGPKPLRSLFALVDSIGQEEWVLPFGINDTILSQALNVIEIVPNRFVGVGANIPITYKEGLLIDFNNLGIVSNYNIINAKMIDSTYNRLIFYDPIFIDTLVVFGGVIGVETEGNPPMETISDTNLFNSITFSNYIQHSTLLTPYSLNITHNNKLLSNSTFKQTGNWDIALSKLNLNLEYDTLDPGTYTYDSLCTTPGLPQSGFIYLNDCNLITSIPSPKEYYGYLQTIPVSVYPNPTNERVNLIVDNTEHHKHITLKCFNLLGRQFYETTVATSQKETSADVSLWPQGMYVAVVYSDGLPVGRCKFVVQ